MIFSAPEMGNFSPQAKFINFLQCSKIFGIKIKNGMGKGYVALDSQIFVAELYRCGFS